MLKEKPFIYPFRTLGGFYFYDVNTDEIVSISEDLFQTFLKNSDEWKDNENFKVRGEIEVLEKNGFLKSDKVEHIYHPDTDHVESILNDNFHHLIIQVTQGCNLRCEYCAYSGHYSHRDHGVKRMSFEMARDAIDFLLDHSVGSNELILGFYGGEPLLEFELIKKCMDYILGEADGKKVSFSLTTNATLLTDEIIETFIKYGLSLTISLDGPKHVHDKNRKFVNGRGSFDTVIEKAEHIREKYPEYFKEKVRFNMVVDYQSSLDDIQEFINHSGLISMYNTSISTVSNIYVKEEFEETKEEIVIQQKMDLMKVYLKRLGRISGKERFLFEREYVDMKDKLYDQHEVVASVPKTAHPGGPCTPGRKRIFMNIDGDFFPCERVSENSKVMKIGNLYEGFNIEQVKEILNVGQKTENECKNCWAYRYCDQCAAYADDLEELSSAKRLKKCVETKTIATNMFRNYCMMKEFGHDFGATSDLKALTEEEAI